MLIRWYKRIRYKRYIPFYILVWTGFGASPRRPQGAASWTAATLATSLSGRCQGQGQGHDKGQGQPHNNATLPLKAYVRSLQRGPRGLLRGEYRQLMPEFLARAACAFAGGYLLNDKLPKGKVVGVTLPLAKAFAQVIQVRTICTAADAMLTAIQQPSSALGVISADCTPSSGRGAVAMWSTPAQETVRG